MLTLSQNALNKTFASYEYDSANFEYDSFLKFVALKLQDCMTLSFS